MFSAFARLAADDDQPRRDNRKRLRDLAMNPTIRVFCAHAKSELDTLR